MMNHVLGEYRLPKEHLQELVRVFDEEISALQRTRNTLLHTNAEALQGALRLMATAPKVLVFGIGKSGLIGQKIAATLTSTGTRAVFLHPTEALHGDIGLAERGDCCLLLSKSGTTAELVALLPTLRSLDLPTIGILGTVDSPLGHGCGVVLDASVIQEACPLGIAPTSSTTVALVLGDALAAALMTMRGFKAQDFAALHAAGQLGTNLTLTVQEVMHSGAALPRVAEGASFREILAELTRQSLGCVCVVREQADGERLVGFITDGDVRRSLQHHSNLDALTTDDIMTRTPTTVKPSALLGTALALMERRTTQLSCLPVVDDATGVLCGVIRVHDIVRVGM